MSPPLHDCGMKYVNKHCTSGDGILSTIKILWMETVWVREHQFWASDVLFGLPSCYGLEAFLSCFGTVSRVHDQTRLKPAVKRDHAVPAVRCTGYQLGRHEEPRGVHQRMRLHGVKVSHFITGI
ncbi:uncharacterized protein CLUP02_00284 [Colletotrichum lupini]|uniref:Uncharacterized protein n=1 Tax=Colletotrichum lupini TaxID=145971 RepID=A0A9Q8S9Y9_9PEZI|nr:uncharacterized protein CLUP02_00284 [Colletotrichum lupini]UQC73639.1 hypothetical protein CLUP02_00284 [Colletotrichum lupini]